MRGQKNFDQEVVQALLDDPTLELKQRGQYLQNGVCPSCGKKELFISVAKPGILKCNRRNNCDYSISTRDLYPEIFNSFSEKFPKTKKNPNATADAYMEFNRGFPIAKIKGWYEQAKYRIPKTNTWVDTVRVYLDDKKERYWERLIDKTKSDGQKNNFAGKRKQLDKNDPDYNDYNNTLIKGEWWAPPTQTIEPGDEVFIVEGIFHAIALHLVGKKAVALTMAGQFPMLSLKEHLKNDVTWVLALDDDHAGRGSMQSHIQKLKNLDQQYKASLTGSNLDWDDLYRLDKLDEKFFEECRHRGNLFTAETIKEKAYYWYKKTRAHHTVLTFRKNLYSIKVSDKLQENLNEAGIDTNLPDENDEEALKVFSGDCQAFNICNCEPDFRYVQVNSLTNERKYFFNLTFPERSRTSQMETLGSALESAANYRKAMLNLSDGGNFTGNAKDFTLMTNRWLNQRQVEKVETFDFIGYAREHDVYIFNDFAFQSGRKIKINNDGFFKLPDANVKTNLGSIVIQDSEEFAPFWFDDFMTAFGMNGLFTLCYWYGALFAEQIRHKLSGFPFHELSGEHGTGKTTLLKFLWKLVGRDGYEGFDLQKATVRGRLRMLSQTANLPLVIIESDRSQGAKSAKQMEVNYDDFKTLYDGGEINIMGVATGGVDTKSHTFRGALVFSQNVSPDGSDAFLSRITHCHFDKKHHTEAGKEASARLKVLSVDQLCGFLNAALTKEKQFMATFEKHFPAVESALAKNKKIRDQRVVTNHAMILAFAKALQALLPGFSDELFSKLVSFTNQRAQSRSSRIGKDHPFVEQFWGGFNLINQANNHGLEDKEYFNHSNDHALIAINLEEVHQEFKRKFIETASMIDLKKLLKESVTYPFVEIKTVRSRLTCKVKHCWIFKKPANSGHKGGTDA